MGRVLLLVSLAIPLGCGAASKSPGAGAEKTDKTAAGTGDSHDGSASRTAAEPQPAGVPPVAGSEPVAKPAEPEPAHKPAGAKPPREIVQLEPPDVSGAKPEPKSAQKTTELVLPHIRLTVPATWVPKKPDVSFLLAEFTLPRAAGDDADGRVTVTTAGSGVNQTLAMWRESFGGKPEKESQQELQILGVWASLVDISGTYRTRPSPSAPLESFPNYRMLGAMCDAGVQEQMYFIKAVGPAKTIAAHADEFRAFLGSMKLKQ